MASRLPHYACSVQFFCSPTTARIPLGTANRISDCARDENQARRPSYCEVLGTPPTCRVMKIAIASDHAGFAYKEQIRNLLQSLGHEARDFGTLSDAPVDYPAFIRP